MKSYRKLIKMWASLIQESLDENIKTNSEELKQEYNFLDNIVRNNKDLEFVLFRNGDELLTSQTIEEMIEKLQNDDWIEAIIDGDCENIQRNGKEYGITYHDDSDYDRDNGYGEYGWYDEDEIYSIASENINGMIDNILKIVEDKKELEYIIKKFNEKNPKDGNEIADFFERNQIVDFKDKLKNDVELVITTKDIR